MLKESKDEIKWELSARLIQQRMHQRKGHFQLEAGFLAYHYENIKKAVSETFEERKKIQKVYFTVKTDMKDICKYYKE